jgi:hypothetical protein
MTLGRIGLIGLIGLLLCTPAWGTLTRKVQYVDPTATGTNDGSSWTNAFHSIEHHEAQNTDLVAADQYLQVYFRGGKDTLVAATTYEGWTTDATHTIALIEDPNNYHDGVWNDACYSIGFQSDTAAYLLILNQSNMIVDGLQVQGYKASNKSAGILVGYADTPSNITIRNCLVKRVLLTGYPGIYVWDSTGTGINIYNNIIWNCDFGVKFYGAHNGIFANNTIANSTQHGIYIESGAVAPTNCRNNLVTGSGTGDDYKELYADPGHVHAYNFTSDATSPDGAGYQSKTFAFVDADANDFHLASTEYYKYNASDPGISGLTADIDGQTRDKWHAGADEVMKPGGRLIGRASVIQQILRRKRQ